VDLQQPLCALPHLSVAAMRPPCRANAYLSSLSPPMLQQGGPERLSFLSISSEACGKQGMTHGCASATKRSASWTSSWAPTRSESLTSKMRRCIRLFDGFKPALPRGWVPTRFTTLRYSPHNGGSETPRRNSSRSSGSTSCTNPRQFRPGCPASSSTFLLRWS
jgi:hypothetical protein